jgi:hypothetical protein
MKKQIAVLTLLAAWPLRAGASGTERPAEGMTLVDGSRAVLAAVVRAAEENSRLPEGQRREKDGLTVFYIRAAAEAARRLPGEHAAGAFLVAIGLGLDDSTILRSNPVVFRFCRQVESSKERATRLRVLGSPTMRGRRDWTQHFVVSCALVEMVGPQVAEAAGVLKEQLDSRPGGSGFSFGDLSADMAGVTFANRLKKKDLSLETLARQFAVKDFVPRAEDLREGMPAEQFERDYGGLDDPRYKTQIAEIRKRIENLGAYKKN